MDSGSDYDYEVDSDTEQKLLESEMDEDEDYLELNPEEELDETLDDTLNESDSKPKEITPVEVKKTTEIETQTPQRTPNNFQQRKNRFNFNNQQPHFNNQRRNQPQPHFNNQRHNQQQPQFSNQRHRNQQNFNKQGPKTTRQQNPRVPNNRQPQNCYNQNNNQVIQPWASGVVPGTMQVQLSSPFWVPTLPYIPITSTIPQNVCNNNKQFNSNQPENTDQRFIINRKRNYTSSTSSTEFNNIPVKQCQNSIFNNNPGFSATIERSISTGFKRNISSTCPEEKNNNPSFSETIKRNISTGFKSNLSSTSTEEKYLELIKEQKKIREEVNEYKEKKRKLLQEIQKSKYTPCIQSPNNINTNYQKNNNKKQNFRQNCNDNFQKGLPNSVRLVNTTSSPSFLKIQVKNNYRVVENVPDTPNITITRTNTSRMFQ